MGDRQNIQTFVVILCCLKGNGQYCRAGEIFLNDFFFNFQAKSEINKEPGEPLLFDPEDQDDEIKDPDYIPPSEHSDDEEFNKILKENSKIQNTEQPKEYIKNTVR